MSETSRENIDNLNKLIPGLDSLQPMNEAAGHILFFIDTLRTEKDEAYKAVKDMAHTLEIMPKFHDSVLPYQTSKRVEETLSTHSDIIKKAGIKRNE